MQKEQQTQQPKKESRIQLARKRRKHGKTLKERFEKKYNYSERAEFGLHCLAYGRRIRRKDYKAMKKYIENFSEIANPSAWKQYMRKKCRNMGHGARGEYIEYLSQSCESYGPESGMLSGCFAALVAAMIGVVGFVTQKLTLPTQSVMIAVCVLLVTWFCCYAYSEYRAQCMLGFLHACKDIANEVDGVYVRSSK